VGLTEDYGDRARPGWKRKQKKWNSDSLGARASGANQISKSGIASHSFGTIRSRTCEDAVVALELVGRLLTAHHFC